VLDNFLVLLQKNPRLQSDDYYEVVNDLQKLVAKDSNVNIVVVAAKCIGCIATGIRKEFSKYAQMVIIMIHSYQMKYSLYFSLINSMLFFLVYHTPSRKNQREETAYC